MKIVIAIVLCALMVASLGFRIKQGTGMQQLAAGATTAVNNALEDTETGINQAIEGTEAYTNCMAACVSPMEFMQCAGDCFAAATQTAAANIAEDTATLQGQLTGAAAAAPAAE